MSEHNLQHTLALLAHTPAALKALLHAVRSSNHSGLGQKVLLARDCATCARTNLHSLLTTSASCPWLFVVSSLSVAPFVNVLSFPLSSGRRHSPDEDRA